jgi:hypothetical protein
MYNDMPPPSVSFGRGVLQPVMGGSAFNWRCVGWRPPSKRRWHRAGPAPNDDGGSRAAVGERGDGSAVAVGGRARCMWATAAGKCGHERVRTWISFT